MKLDIVNGNLLFATGVVGAEADEAAFLRSPAAATAKLSLTHAGWRNYDFHPEPDVYATAYFFDGRLEMVGLSFALPFEGEEPCNWNCEPRRKEKHDAWLREEIGRPPYIRRWGEILSISDPKSGVSSIDVHYDGPLGPMDYVKRLLRHLLSVLMKID